MKRFRSFLLFSAVAALLAFAGSAWAAASSDVSIDVSLLSLDHARVAAVSFDLSLDKTTSRDRLVSISSDLSVDANLAKITIKTSADKASAATELLTFNKGDKVNIFAVRSLDAFVSVDAFVVSVDNSHDLHVAFPILLFERGSGDVNVTSSDNKFVSFDILQKYKGGSMALESLKSGSNVMLAVKGADGYTKVSADNIASNDFAIVTKSATISKDDYVEFNFSKDVTSKDMLIVRVKTASADKLSLSYGVVYTAEASADLISADYVRLFPQAQNASDNKVELKVYNVSKDKISSAFTFTRAVISGEPVIHYIVSNDTEVLKSKDVKVSFDDPGTWVAKDLTSTDLSFDKDISGWKVASGDAYDFTTMAIVTSDLTLYASFDAGSAATGTLTVEVSGDKKISTDVEGTLTAIVKLNSEEVSKDVTYQWYKASSTTKSASDDTKAGTSAELKVSSDVATKLYYYVVVSLDSQIASSEVTTVEVVSAEAETTPTVTLSSLAVTVSPAAGTYDVSADKADSIPLTMTVVGNFSDSSSKDVTTSTTNTWTLGSSVDTKIFSLSSSSGETTKIVIASTITSGEYSVPVTAKAVSGDVSKDVKVTYTIVASGSSATPGSDAADAAKDAAKAAVADAIKGITNPSIDDVLKSQAAVDAIKNTVTSTGELDMSVLDGVTSLKGLATLLTTLGNVKSLNFATMGSKLTTIDNLDGVTLDSIILAGNAYITTVNLTGANIPVVNAKGSSALTSITVAGNTAIEELDIGETQVASLDVKNCTNLATLDVDNSSANGQGSLKELDIEGCVNLEKLTLTNNQLLGLRKPSGLRKTMTVNATRQRRSASFASASFNFWTFLWNTILEKTGAFSPTAATFDVTLIRITEVNGTTLSSAINPNTTSGDVTFDSTPNGLKYTVNTDGFIPSGFEASGVVTSANGDGMDVTLGSNSSDGSTTTEAKLGSSSGGGCDAGFGFGALAALMAVFALKKKR